MPALRHIGVIMDGNGRWASSRNLPRSAGHLEGLKSAKRFIADIAGRGIEYVTLYTFSTENWKRSSQEVSYLMNLLAKNIKREYPFYTKHNIRLRHTGNADGLNKSINRSIREAVEYTAGNTGLTVTLAINYGGRDEIIRAMSRYLTSYKNTDPVQLDEKTFPEFLDNPDIPDPELIIRTAGEPRLSNFLLWQSAYSELFFSDTLWPDWTSDDLDAALTFFSGRKRKFGGIDRFEHHN